MAKNIETTLTLNTRQFDSSIKTSQQQVTRFGNDGTKSFGKLAAAVGGLVAAAKGLSGIISTGANFQDLRDSLNAVFGSAQKGAQAFDRIKKFSLQTQFGVDQLTNAFIQLKGAGVEPTEKLLMVFADTASVTTDQMGTFQAALDLVSRSTAGGLGLEDLNRLADKGIPVFQILQEKLGLARLEVSEFGKSADGANKIIAALTDGLEERFGGTLQTKLDNVNVKFSNLKIAVGNLADEIFMKLEPVLVDILDAFTELATDSAEFVANLDDVGLKAGELKEKLDGVVKVMQDFSAIVAIIVGGSLVGFMVRLGTSIVTATAGLGTIISGLLTFRKIAFTAFAVISLKVFELISQFDQLGTTVSGILVNAFKIMANTIVGIMAGIGETIITAFREPFIMMYRIATEGFDNIDAILEEGGGNMMEAFGRGFENGANLFDLGPAAKAVQDEFQDFDISGFFDDDGFTDMQFINEDIANKVSESAVVIKDAGEQITSSLAKIAEEMQTNFLTTLGQASKALSEDLADSLLEGKNAMEGFKTFFKSIVKQLIADAIRLFVVEQILSSIFGFFAPTKKLTFSGGKAAIEPRAAGGPVMKNRPYIVGEMGEELFVPNQNGSIVPNSGLGGGTTINYNIQATDAPSFQALIARDPEFIYSVTEAGRRRIPGSRV